MVGKRFLRRRGFGVHSPLAYSLIRDTLRRGRERYYAYDEMEAEPRSAMLETALRVLCRFAPRRVQVDTPAMAEVVRRYDPCALVNAPEPDFAITRDPAPRPCPCLVLDADPGPQAGRMVIASRRYALVVPHPSEMYIRI